MKTSISIKITALILALSFAVPSAYALYPAQSVEAQAQGKAASCVVGLITATGASVPGWVKEIIGVPDGNGNTGQHLADSAANNQASFNSCVLQPLAKIMIVSLIRNIGSSIVDWVNSGFNGSPTFITDFEGTLLDAADQAVGTFIEGSELGFLCNDFSFQIRIALALRYSSGFRQRATCTLTQIGNNIETNGGRGWDNFLQLTTQPQNNAYGASVIADSELTQRAFRAVGVKGKEISVGQGFLSFKTCDEWETPVVESNYGSDENYGGAKTLYDDVAGGTAPTAAPVCKRESVKTPGSVIAGKLNSTFAQGDIQAAVAQEIDDVIAATMNQLAQKAITGAYGLLGLSKKRTTTQSYLAKYQSQLYGVNSTQNTGATSPLEDYQVTDYNAAAALVNGDAQVQQIYNSTNVAANQSVAQTIAQQEAINSAYGGSDSAQNFALLKVASQSSLGAGPAANAVNGITDGAASQYNVPAGTGEEQNPWWQVDLGDEKDVKEVRIWRVTNDSAANTLGTIHVIASDGPTSNVWTSNAITPTDSDANPIVIPVGLTRRYIRIEKQSALDTQCRVIYENRGENTYESCYHPLQLAEVQVMGTTAITVPGASIATSTASTNAPQDDGKAATSTVALATATAAGTVTASAPLSYELRMTNSKAITAATPLTIKSYFQKNGVAAAYLSVFSSFDFAFGRQGETLGAYSIAPGVDSGSFAVTNVTNSNTSNYYVFRQTGAKKVGAPTGDYVIKTTIEDAAGNILSAVTTSFTVQ